MVKKTYRRNVNKAVKKAIGRYYRVTVNRLITLVGQADGKLLLAGLEEAYDLGHILTGSSSYMQLGKQFALVKLRGIYLECVPASSGSGAGMCCLAIQQADEPNNQGVWTQPNVMPVCEHQITKKYIPINSGWEPTNALQTISSVKLAYQILQNFSISKNWNILVKLYFTFKSSV